MKNMNLWQKLLEVKKGVPYIKKDKKNEFFNYTYPSGTQVLTKINALLNEYGIITKMEVIDCRIDDKVEKTKNGDKHSVLYNLKMKCTFINADNQEEREVYEWHGSGANGIEKGYGSALTYAERYFYLKAFQIPTDDLDPDAMTPPESAPKAENRGNTYDNLLKENKKLFTDDEYMKYTRKSSWTKDYINTAINQLEKLIKEKS
jgi:hypothetical protein